MEDNAMVSKKDAFTLIELSVVIVIIGLIVAGIVAGQSLVNQAKLRAFMSDINQIETAINTFRLRFDQKPGDITNISDYYSITDGNGDGQININSAESRTIWEALEQSGLYVRYLRGTPVPEFSIVNGYTAFDKDAANGPFYRFQVRSSVYDKNNVTPMEFGDIDSLSRLNEWLSTRDTIAMDEKMDDGLASSGKMYASQNVDDIVSGQCGTGSGHFGNTTSGTYNFADGTGKCLLFFFIW